MSVSAPTSGEKTVDLKNPFLACGLALLLPGLGHFYQGRTFKAGIYCICILGLFFSGQALGEWKVVYLGDSDSGGRLAAGNGVVKRLLQGYAAQFPVGVLAWPAIIQSDRYRSEDELDERRARLEEVLEAPFHGGILVDDGADTQVVAELTGTIRLEPPGSAARSTFVGTLSDGTKVELPLAAVIELGRRISAAETRTVATQLGELPEAIKVPAGSRPYLHGSIPRPFFDRYQVPLGDQGEDVLTAKLGGRLEIAYVFTWIAGLLNVLAIWDAFDGPAYGYGTELEEQMKRRKRKPNDQSEPSDEALPRRPEPAGQPS